MNTSNRIEIIQATSSRQIREFIDFPHSLYRNDPIYVPRLFMQERELLSKKNPYFEHSEAGFFLARRGSETVGRIAWFLNNNHIKQSGRREILFGYFDAVNDQSVADALLSVVQQHGISCQCDSILGPIEFSTNDTCGLLIDGFNLPPMILMPYNAPYYTELLTKAGYVSVQELHAFDIRTEDKPEFLAPLVDRITLRLTRLGIQIRPLDFKRLDVEAETLFRLYEGIYSKNWGYIPITKAEFLHQAKGLKQIAIPDFVLVAERQGAAIGYAVGIWDANETFSTFKNGRLFPFNFIKLLNIDKAKHMKILNLGVLPEYRALGVDVVMYAHYFDTAKRLGIASAEASYVMGSNESMRKALIHINARLTKKYAIFQRDLEP
jgi:ribosomal protein S18 acetylase RimI-like enzyme